MSRILFILALLASSLSAQNALEYMATASTTALTIQQPAVTSSGVRTVQFRAAWVYCASASTATLSWNGTAATATAGTALKIPPTFQAASASVFTGSNVGSGTTGPVYNVPAGLTYVIDLSKFAMGTSGSATNLTITTNNSCTISLAWTERQ